VAVVLFLCAPWAGAAVGRWAYGDARAHAAVQRAERQRVTAEVTGCAPETLPLSHGGPGYAYRATVRWTEPGGGARTGEARVPAGTRAGDRADVWFDARAARCRRPRTRRRSGGTPCAWPSPRRGGTVLVVLLVHAAVRRAADRRRLRGWDRDWARVEPGWSRRV
jgi:hypothetical protein